MFWNAKTWLQFIVDASERLHGWKDGDELYDQLSEALKWGKVLSESESWLESLDKKLRVELLAASKYDGKSVRDLLRAMRNLKCHYHKLTSEAQMLLGSIPDGLVQFFEARFPLLLPHTYDVFEICYAEANFTSFYQGSL